MNTPTLEIVHNGRAVIVRVTGPDTITVKRGDLSPELQAYLLANKAAIIATATAPDRSDGPYSWERPGAAIWHGSDGSETAVHVLAHLGGGFCRVRSLLDGREYDVQADRLQMETATTAPRTGATGRKWTNLDKPGERQGVAA